MQKSHWEQLGAKPQNDTVAVSDGTVTKANGLQGTFLRVATGAMKTTPTEALEIALSILPLDLRVISCASTTAYRLRCEQKWKSTGQGHTQLGLINANPFTEKSDSIQRKYQINKAFKTRISSREEWLDSKLKPGPNEDYWFTDASGYNERFGAAIYRLKDGCGGSFPLGQHATVFQAEVLGIAKCAEHLVAKETEGMKIFICSYSQAAIKALEKATTNFKVVWECMQALATLGERNKVTLTWDPGHHGIQGNEEADWQARRGTEGVPPEGLIGMPFAVGKKIIKDHLQWEFEKRWRTSTTCRQAKLFMGSQIEGLENFWR
ncbi:uncharacterized protein LOC107046024 [Diachasma alloeum]|uniref:uncharacterized protein LOC107046024 n=1 Tax=Diachasma alloeum TaxID=454923 RepID=UPI00073828A1|nr:uncharacterized protein LOC107046024 [Diachasma alloeum]